MKVPIFYYIDQGYLTLFFCMQSDFVIYVNSGVTCGVIWSIFFLQKVRLQTLYVSKNDRRIVYNQAICNLTFK